VADDDEDGNVAAGNSYVKSAPKVVPKDKIVLPDGSYLRKGVSQRGEWYGHVKSGKTNFITKEEYLALIPNPNKKDVEPPPFID
jgi:hypothetical protein